MNSNAIVQGVARVIPEAVINSPGIPMVMVKKLPDPPERGTGIDARAHRLRERALETLRLVENAPPELAAAVASIEPPGELADFVTGLLSLTLAEKQEILETSELLPRLDLVISRLAYRHEVLKLSYDIGQQTREALGAHQREFLLREQLKAIQKELGGLDDKSPDMEDLKRQLEQTEMPADVAVQANREMRRLGRMPDGTAEAGMVRSYLEWLSELPWKIVDERPIDIPEARRVLDEDHFGLTKVKRRIIEFLAVRKLNPDGKGTILCFVGPPGVGKTSLGQSIARAVGRKFVRVSLGEVHDEAEIRGHRGTYVGAMPGNVIQAIRRAGERNCVLMLDEIDKLGMGGFQGDPSSALLEVLDPEQNGTFRDAYLDVPFDLSRVLFIGTANMLDTIPAALLDRMEVVRLSGYTAEEMVAIARRHLIPRQLIQNGLAGGVVDLDDSALNLVIDGYTREAGVRNLEREIGALFRNEAVTVAEGSVRMCCSTPMRSRQFSDPAGSNSDVAQRRSIPGVATGLAWTPVGGDILFIEASRMPGTGKLILTGQLGDGGERSGGVEPTEIACSRARYHA